MDGNHLSDVELTPSDIAENSNFMSSEREVDEPPASIPEESELTVEAEMEGAPVEEPLPPTIHAGLEG